MTKKKARWKEWLPKRPFKPEETIRDWDPLNVDWDDETICALCGKSHECKCYDEYYCNCGEKNKNCKWPHDKGCPCIVCDQKRANCVCKKEN